MFLTPPVPLPLELVKNMQIWATVLLIVLLALAELLPNENQNERVKVLYPAIGVMLLVVAIIAATQLGR